MKITSKGQVTIPVNVREELSIRPAIDEVEFVKSADGEWIVQKAEKKSKVSMFSRLRGVATVQMTTDEIMALTRGPANE